MVEKDIRYDMPAQFGPSLLPDQSETEATVVVVSFETTSDAVRSILPRFFSAPEKPTISFSRISYENVDYLGGRGYQEIVVGVSAVYEGGGRRIEANFAPVLWVDQPGPLMAGREFQGLAKLHGDFSPIAIGEEQISTTVSEYGAPLLTIEANQLKQISSDKIEKLNASASHVNTLGWKYIHGWNGQADADYPILSVMRWTYRSAWTGMSHIKFGNPSATDAPFSARVIAKLSGFPLLEAKRAFVGQGKATIDRAATERLERPL